MLICIAAILCLAASPARAALTTTSDGSLQAIAQSPSSIDVYWRHGGREANLYVNGRLLGSYQPSADSPFAHATASSLSPNTMYTFSLGESGPEVGEKTWSVLQPEQNFDLLVVGGTASGVAAAVSGAQMGLRVALVESTNRVGGMSVNGLGAADIRNPLYSNGFFEDMRRRIADFYGGGTGLKFEPRIAHAVIKSMLYEQPCVALYLKTTAVAPVVSGNRVVGAEVRDSVSGRCGRICAAVTIDATDTADFARAARACMRAGREPRSDCEPHAGMIYFDDIKQEILPGSTGQGDGKVQSYAYLMVLKDYGAAGAPLVKEPRYYDPATFRPSPQWESTWGAKSGKLPNDKYEINQHPFGTDWPGINYDYPRASERRRQEVEAMYRDRALGYLYFLQNERGHKNLGLADDEFLDNGNFPVGLYVREADRLLGEQNVLECEVTNARDFHRINSIGLAGYVMDSHAMEDLKDPSRRDKGEGELFLSKSTPWSQVPYGVIVPKGVEGLLVTTAVSASHIGYGTLRLEPVRMSMGQAAAAAAYWSISAGIPLRSVNPSWIQDKVLAQGSYINFSSDVNRDTRHFPAIHFLGARGVFQDDNFRPTAHITEAEAADALDQLVALESWRGQRPVTVPARKNALDPESPTLTRGQFAIMLVDAKRKVDAAWSLSVPAIPSYSDVPVNSPYFCAVQTLLAHRISAMLFDNAEPGYFRPDAPLTRADAAEAIYLAHRAYAMNYWMP